MHAYHILFPFSIGCIVQWARVRQNPRCPLCAVPFGCVVLGDGREMPLERGKATNDLPDEGFAGLDHSFFLGDLRRLLQRTRHIQNQTSRGPTFNQLQEIIDILTSHESDSTHCV